MFPFLYEIKVNFKKFDKNWNDLAKLESLE